MTKIFLLVALISFGTITAQTEKGKFAISGTTGLGFNSTTVKYDYAGQTSDGPRTSSFTISPSVGYFVIDNLEISLALDYKNTKTKSQMIYLVNNPSTGFDEYVQAADTKSTQNTFSIIPNATYFFSKDKFRPYIAAGIGFAVNKQESSTTQSSTSGAAALSKQESDSNGFVWSAGGGLAYFVSKEISFDLGLAYAKYTFKENDVNTKSGGIGANIGISVFLN